MNEKKFLKLINGHKVNCVLFIFIYILYVIFITL